MTSIGTNLQTPFPTVRPIRAYEKSTISAVSSANENHPSFTSLAQPSRSRSTRYRDNENLKPWQVDQLHQADTFAAEIGLPLNRFLSIAWRLTDAGRLDVEAFRCGMKRMCQWLRDNRAEPAWVYTHENPVSIYGDDRPNTHLLLHLPRRIRRCDFDAMLPGWFGAWDGGVKPEPRTHPGYVGPDRLLYMAKGAHYLTCRKYGGYRLPGGQGVVTVKRSGTSQNIGWAARQASTTRRRAA